MNDGVNKIFKTPLANPPSAPGTCNQACSRCGEGLAGWTPPLCLDCEEFCANEDGVDGPCAGNCSDCHERGYCLPTPVVGWDANGSPVLQ